MTVTVDIVNDCAQSWTPDEQTCQNWAEMTLDQLELEGQFDLSLRFVASADSQQLNGQYRDKHCPTNVLSFPVDLPEQILESLDSRPLGDVVICPEILEKEADEQGKTLESHWTHMLIHGVLHLLGHDHLEAEQAELMENLEIQVLKKLGIPNPYLIG